MNTLTKLTTITVLSLTFAGGASAVSYNLLTDGFEGYTLGPVPDWPPVPISATNPPPGLAGDQAAIVTGPIDGVSPRNGTQMLQFLNTDFANPLSPTGNNSDLYYVLDLTLYAASIDNGHLSGNTPGTVDLSAWFNTGPNGINDKYFLGLGVFDETFTDDPYNDIRDEDLTGSRIITELTSVGTPLDTDADPASWEQMSLSMQLPSGTRYVAARIAGRRDGNNGVFISSFADDVLVDLDLPSGFVPNPQPPNPPTAPASGSTVVFLATALAGLTFVGKRRGAKS